MSESDNTTQSKWTFSYVCATLRIQTAADIFYSLSFVYIRFNKNFGMMMMIGTLFTLRTHFNNLQQQQFAM